MKNREQYIYAGFDSEEKLAAFSKILNQEGFRIDYLISDIPVKNPDITCKPVKSYIGLAGLVAGFSGVILAFLFQYWVTAIAYPLMTGGKSSFPLLSFIPVMFESGVLFAASAMVILYFIENSSSNKKQYKALNDFQEAYKIAIKAEGKYQTGVIIDLLASHNAVEINVKVTE